MTKRKSKKDAPPPPESMDAEVPRELTEEEINVRSRHLATLTIKIRDVERRRRKITRECNEELKELREQQLIVAEQIETGLEQVRQGDLFAGEPGRITEEAASRGLAEVAAHAEEPSEKPEAAACEHGYTGRCSECEGADEESERPPARGLEKIREFQSTRDAAASGSGGVA